jgi:hypothetical protein
VADVLRRAEHDLHEFHQAVRVPLGEGARKEARGRTSAEAELGSWPTRRGACDAATA